MNKTKEFLCLCVVSIGIFSMILTSTISTKTGQEAYAIKSMPGGTPGYCKIGDHDKCMPCDAGLPGGDIYCTEYGKWLLEKCQDQSRFFPDDPDCKKKRVNTNPSATNNANTNNAGNSPADEGCLNTSPPSQCISCDLSKPGCIPKDEFPKPIPMNKEHTSGVLKNDKIPNKNKDENVKKDGEAKKDDNNSPTSQ